MLQALHQGSRWKPKVPTQTSAELGSAGSPRPLWKLKRQSKEGESLEVCTASLMTDEPIQMPDYGALRDTEAQSLGENTTALLGRHRDHLTLIPGKSEVRWQLRTMTFLGEHGPTPKAGASWPPSFPNMSSCRPRLLIGAKRLQGRKTNQCRCLCKNV